MTLYLSTKPMGYFAAGAVEKGRIIWRFQMDRPQVVPIPPLCRSRVILRDGPTYRSLPVLPAFTLDEALLGMSTFYNGCDYRLRFEGKRTFVEFGCYGVHRNLEQGDRRRFMERIEANGGEMELLDVAPETILELKKRKPCERCGGFTHKIIP